jgi:hypothetical protein
MAHAGLVDSIKMRADETRTAIERMEQTNSQLRVAIETLTSIGNRAGDTFQQAQKTFEKASETFTGIDVSTNRLALESAQVATQVAALSASAKAVPDKLQRLDQTVGIVADHMSASHDRAAEAWRTSGDELLRRVGEIATTASDAARLASKAAEDASLAASKAAAAVAAAEGRRSAATTTGGVSDAESLAMLRRIASGIEKSSDSRKPRLLEYVALVVLAVLASGGVTALVLLRLR